MRCVANNNIEKMFLVRERAGAVRGWSNKFLILGAAVAVVFALHASF